MSRSSSGRFLGLIGCILATLTTAAVLSAGYGDTRRAIVLSVVLTAITTFFSFLWLGVQRHAAGELTDQNLRTAIAASTVLSYLVLVGMGVWYPKTPEESSENARALLNIFTTIVGIIVAFYFGSTAYVDVNVARRGNPEAETPTLK